MVHFPRTGMCKHPQEEPCPGRPSLSVNLVIILIIPLPSKGQGWQGWPHPLRPIGSMPQQHSVRVNFFINGIAHILPSNFAKHEPFLVSKERKQICQLKL